MATAHNTANTDTRTFDKAMLNLSLKDHCARSIAFAAKRIDLLRSGRSNGDVCRDVGRNAFEGVIYHG